MPLRAATSLIPLLAALAQGGGGGPDDEIGASCMDCHPGIVRSYRDTGMARALQPIGARDVALLGQLGTEVEPDGPFGYHFEVEGNTARIVESWGPPGQRARVGEAELRFAIGAGLRDRSFAAARGGALWLAPLEVLTVDGGMAGEAGEAGEEGEAGEAGEDGGAGEAGKVAEQGAAAGGAQGHRAVLAPAHEQIPGTRFRVPITRGCLRCHTDRLPQPTYPDNCDQQGWSPRGISCAACHGDVSAHVAWQQASLAGADPAHPDPVTSSRTMGRIERVSVCARCHLQGDARIPLTAAGRDLPPLGADLLDHVAIWGGPADTSDIGFVSHVERLVGSACFQATAGWGARAMSCETCHDPHRPSRDPQERARVRAACLECHAAGADERPAAPPCSRAPQAAAAEPDCVACHMRQTPVFDLSEVRIHDHRIEVRPPPPSHFERIRSKQATSELERFRWPDAEPPLSGDPGLELMARRELGWADAALAWIDAEPAPQVLAMPDYHRARAKLLEGRELANVVGGLEADRARLEAARQAYERALELDPTDVEAALRLAPLCAYLGRTREALGWIETVITRFPAAAEPLRVRALVRLRRQDLRGAVRDYEAAQARAPDAQGALALAALYARLGEVEAAQRWRAAAARLDPAAH